MPFILYLNYFIPQNYQKDSWKESLLESSNIQAHYQPSNPPVIAQGKNKKKKDDPPLVENYTISKIIDLRRERDSLILLGIPKCTRGEKSHDPMLVPPSKSHGVGLEMGIIL